MSLWTVAQLARLLHPRNSPGKHTWVGSHSLLQGIFSTQGWNPSLLHYRPILHHLSHQISWHRHTADLFTSHLLTYYQPRQVGSLYNIRNSGSIFFPAWEGEGCECFLQSSPLVTLYAGHHSARNWSECLLVKVILATVSPVAQQWRIHQQCRRHRRCAFDPWVRKILWRREWQPTPAFLPGESHGQRSWVGYSPQDCRITGSQRVRHNWSNTHAHPHTHSSY